VAGEELLTQEQLLASFPDNADGLIEAVDSRSFVVSASMSVGFLEDNPVDTPVTIPQTSGLAQDIPVELTNPLFVGHYWALDSNNHFVPDYVSQGISVPAGLDRIVHGTVVMEIASVSTPEQSYTFQGTEGGIFIGSPVTRDIGGTPTVLSFVGVSLYDTQVGPPLSITVTPVGHSFDLILSDLRMSVQGGMI